MSTSVIPSSVVEFDTALHSGEYFYPIDPHMESTYDGDLSTRHLAWDRIRNLEMFEEKNFNVDASWYYYFKKDGVGAAIPLDEILVWGYALGNPNRAAFVDDGLWRGWIYVIFAGESTWTQVAYNANTVFGDGCGDNVTRYYEVSAASGELTSAVEAIRVRQRYNGSGRNVCSLGDKGYVTAYVGLREIGATTPIVDSGLRVTGGDSDSTVYYLAQHDGAPDPSADDIGVRFGKGSTVHTLFLTDPANEDATPLRVRTADGIRSVRRFGS